MAFSETLKSEIRKRAHFCCCLCHALGVEIHHIVPQADDGEDTEDNAAPLCPSCHETYGANPEKRKFLREARDFWYEVCAKRYAPDPDRLDEISRLLQTAATKSDLDHAINRVVELMRSTAAREEQSVSERAHAVAQLGTLLAPGVGVNRRCTRCGTTIGLFVGDQGHCPSCGTPW
jgi:5-methylcytosine-specific restriction endonuclease McrA